MIPNGGVQPMVVVSMKLNTQDFVTWVENKSLHPLSKNSVSVWRLAMPPFVLPPLVYPKPGDYSSLDDWLAAGGTLGCLCVSFGHEVGNRTASTPLSVMY